MLSPGMLYGGLDIATAKMGKSRCRNEAIAEAFHYMHIIESWEQEFPDYITEVLNMVCRSLCLKNLAMELRLRCSEKCIMVLNKLL